MEFDPAVLDTGIAYRLLSGAVAPRPIAFISSMGSDGSINLAPFSFFNAACSNPPILLVSINRRDGDRKNTARNVISLGEYVVNVVDEELAEFANQASF